MTSFCSLRNWAFALLAILTLGAQACSKQNDVTANSNVDCGEDAVKCIPCEPGELDCDKATLLECKEDGFGFAVRAECESAQLCAEGLVEGSCRDPLCVSGEVQCVGAIMQICASGRHRYDLIACQSEDACLRGIENGNCSSVECSEASDCTGEDTQCRRRVCVEGRCEVENLPSDTACTIGDVNGVCDGDGACRATDECTTAQDCSGEDTECRIRVCVQGACGFADIPSGVPCERLNVAGECNGEGACEATEECTIASDCPGEDTQCQVRACVQGVCGFASLPAGSVCDVEGLAGSCDGEGSCQIEADCNIATDCPGSDTECRTRSCENGSCGFELTEQGATCSEDGLGGECDGAGGCTITQQCRTDGDCPGISTECRRPRCSNGRCGTQYLSGSCTIGISQGRCSGGSCECIPQNLRNIMFCSNECVSTIDNDDHCGACGRSCDASENEVCSGTVCGCPDDYIRERRCNGVCRDIAQDPNHCGGCGVVCPNNSMCVYGGVAGCGASNTGACHCDVGFQVCHDPTNNAGLRDTCIPFPSQQWDDAGCQADDRCPREVPD